MLISHEFPRYLKESLAKEKAQFKRHLLWATLCPLLMFAAEYVGERDSDYWPLAILIALVAILSIGSFISAASAYSLLKDKEKFLRIVKTIASFSIDHPSFIRSYRGLLSGTDSDSSLSREFKEIMKKHRA